ncbi:unnamed protein product, partial [marine sediment metagenome]
LESKSLSIKLVNHTEFFYHNKKILLNYLAFLDLGINE